MAPRETRFFVSAGELVPSWTKPTSTRKDGSPRRFRFSTEPEERRISRRTFSLAKISLYRSPNFAYVPPSKPVVIVRVFGGVR